MNAMAFPFRFRIFSKAFLHPFAIGANGPDPLLQKVLTCLRGYMNLHPSMHCTHLPPSQLRHRQRLQAGGERLRTGRRCLHVAGLRTIRPVACGHHRSGSYPGLQVPPPHGPVGEGPKGTWYPPPPPQKKVGGRPVYEQFNNYFAGVVGLAGVVQLPSLCPRCV